MGKLDVEGPEEDKRKDRNRRCRLRTVGLRKLTDSSKVCKYDDNNHESAPLDHDTLITLVIP